MIVNKKPHLEKFQYRPNHLRRTLKSQTLKELKDIANQEREEQNALISSATYKLLDIDEIRYWAEDSLIKLNIVTQSQVKREIKADAQELADNINRILALSELWLQVQNKVRQ